MNKDKLELCGAGFGKVTFLSEMQANPTEEASGVLARPTLCVFVFERLVSLNAHMSLYTLVWECFCLSIILCI